MKVKYKFKIGQTVRFRDVKAEDKECPSCGHVETNYINIVRQGRVVAKKHVLFVSAAPGVGIVDDIKTLPDGRKVLTPRMAKLTVEIPRPAYEIIVRGRSLQTVSEESIVLVKV